MMVYTELTTITIITVILLSCNNFITHFNSYFSEVLYGVCNRIILDALLINDEYRVVLYV